MGGEDRPDGVITARRALKPMIEAWATAKQETREAGALERLELREGALEERMARIERVVGGVVEDTEFLKALGIAEQEE